MKNRRFFPLPTSLIASLMLGLTVPASTFAQLTSPGNLPEELAIFDPPPGEGEPIDSAGGASRGCPLDPEQGAALVAAIPRLSVSEENLTDVKGLTVSPHPTFYFYLPYASQESLETARFSLKDEDDRDIYLTTVSLPSTPGLVSVTVPEDTPALEANKRYRWYFTVVCQSASPEDFPESIAISGEIGRIELDPTLREELERAQPLERAILYARNGIWFDALKHLADLKRVQPEDPIVASNWDALFTSVGLEEIAREPLLDCCSVETEISP